MKALVLCAGLGTRLRPLTDGLPKCMLPVAGRPLLASILDLLRGHGIEEVYINLHWYPDSIREHFGGGTDYGVHITYLEEAELSGTAGPVRKLRAELGDGTFLVLNGDNLTDLDITSLVGFHETAGAELTVALHEEDASELPDKSVVQTDDDGRIRRFVEKPQADELFSSWSSAGIYVLEPGVIDMIPEGSMYDFGHDLIPAMLAENRPVYGYKAAFYLLDIGTQDAYARAERDVIAGRV
jgi:mannose-1-phosphate guanylyltransferase/phosphomannomutase